MKRLISLILTLVAFFPITGHAQTENSSILKVMSYNIRNGEASDGTNSWIYRYASSAIMLLDQKPDIFGIQEAYNYQVNYLNEVLDKDYKSVGVGREDGKSKGEHMSVFYNKKRFSLKKWGTFWLSETPDKPSKGWDADCIRTATWTLLKDKESGKSFFFINTHLDHVGVTARQEGLKLIISKIAELNAENLPVILVGDFNVLPDDPSIQVVNETMLNARITADRTDDLGSFNGWGKEKEKKQIDYIFYSGFEKCSFFQTVTKEYDKRTFISDHFPIMADLVL